MISGFIKYHFFYHFFIIFYHFFLSFFYHFGYTKSIIFFYHFFIIFFCALFEVSFGLGLAFPLGIEVSFGLGQLAKGLRTRPGWPRAKGLRTRLASWPSAGQGSEDKADAKLCPQILGQHWP